VTNLFLSLLAERPWLLADGATGTNLFARGLAIGEAPDMWNLENPDAVRDHYRSFIEAGSDIVLTNTFGGTANRLKLHKAEGKVHEINATAAKLLRQEADAAGRPVVVAGSMGPTGDLFEPLGPVTHEQGVAAFKAQAEALAEGGADVLWIETLSAETEIRAAVEGASSTGLPIVVTLSFDTNGRTMMGVTPAQWAALATSLPTPLAGFGGNCGVGASELVAALIGLSEAAPANAVLVAKSNCGVPAWVDGEIVYSGTPDLMADYARLARDAGARIVGGCCGTTPEHVAAMRASLDGYTPGPRPTLDEVTARLGAVSDGTVRLGLLGPESSEAAGRGRRRRRASF
jgi:5-methyltetrahydrofolate--homocysteine methyltransferase